MADLEMRPDAVVEEVTSTLSEEVKAQVEEVTQQAAAIDAAPILDVDTKVTEAAIDTSTKFTEDEMKQIRDVAEKIDITDTTTVIGFGASAQKKVADFADGALESVRGKDMGETGQILSALLVELKNSGEPKKGWLGNLFSSGQRKFEELKAQYSSTEANIDRLVELLEQHETQLNKDIAQLDKLYDKNKLYFKEVSMYIEAGKLAIEKAKTGKLVELQEKAKQTNDAADVQEAQDFADQITRFEKKIYDLELSRTVCLQSAPEIRMVQNNDTIMSEKIRSTIINVVPMWKTQMVLALNNYHTEQAIKAENAVTDATNDMLKKNAELLHQSSVAAAEASERGIVDIETLQNTNAQLISALDEIQKIQENGKVARAEAEKELGRIEQELKDKMLTVASNAGKGADEILAEQALEAATQN